MPTAPRHAQPSPALLFDTFNAYQRTAALKGAIELDLFSAIGGERATAAELARRCHADARGMRILCDYLVVIGFLLKQGDRYGLTPDSAVFLDRKSPAYLGGMAEFIASPQQIGCFADVAALVRKGGTLAGPEGHLAPEHPAWVAFARAMAPLMAMPAEKIADLAAGEAAVGKVLDIAAGHGLFGLAIAKRHPAAEIHALDWPNVLAVAGANAAAAGLDGRYHMIAGSAFEQPFGDGYDIVLLTNFLHHFDPEACERLLRKVHRALKPGGRAVALEFVPNEDRVSPPTPATFALMMLATTPRGDAYTFPEYERMFRGAGFARSDMHAIPPSEQRVVIGYK